MFNRYVAYAIAGLIGTSLMPGAVRAAPSARMLVEVFDFAGVTLSPDGEWVAYRREQASIERNAYDTAWYVQNLRRPGPALKIADGGETLRDGAGLSTPEVPQWSPDSRWLYFRALHDQEIQVWRAAADGSRAEPVTHDSANVSRFVLTREGARLIYEVGASRAAVEAAEMAEYDEGIRYDETIHGGQNLFRSFPIEGRLASHRTAARKALLSDAATHRQAVDLSTLETVDVGDVDEATFKQAAQNLILSPDETRSAAFTREGAGSSLQVRTLAGGANLDCVPCRSLTIDGVAWRSNDELIFTARDGVRDIEQSLYAWRPGADRLRLIVRSNGLLNGNRLLTGSTCAVGAQYAACVTASAAVPPRLERIDLDNGRRQVLDDSNAALAAEVQRTTSVEALKWADGSGRTFTGYLFTPASRRADERMPLFLTYYVCPGYNRGGYGDEWPLQAMASAGVAALCINSAPITEYALDDYEIGLQAVSSVIVLLDRRGLIDPQRVGMGGLSFGSEVTTYVATRSNLLAAASIANSQPSPAGYWAKALLPGWTETVRRRWRYGGPDETPDQWREVSATSHVDAFHAPYLMQLPEGEYRGNLELYVRLVQARRPVEMWVYPNETHQKSEPRHRLSANERNLDWFRFWLQGYIDPNPVKREQYQRWEAMRELQRSSDGG